MLFAGGTKKPLLQERLELSTFAFLSTVLTYKYDALTDCATGAWQPGIQKAGNFSNGHEKGAEGCRKTMPPHVVVAVIV